MKELSAFSEAGFRHYYFVENLLIVLLVKEIINKDVLMKEPFFLFKVMVVTILWNTYYGLKNGNKSKIE
jgi:hypothetical protein